MTDEDKNTDPKATTKPKTTDAAKTAPKAKSKAKPKAAAKSTAADTAPYLKKGSNTESSHTQAATRKSSTPMILLLIFAVLIVTTVYKFNEEHNNLAAQVQTDTQENTVMTESTPVAMEQAAPDNSNIDAASAQTPEQQQVSLTYLETDGQAVEQAEVPVAINDELMQQRQSYEKEIQSKRQQFKALMETRQKERAEVIAKQKAELQRIKQKQLETRMKAQEIQKQILALHEKLHQLMKEAHAQNRP